MIDSMNRLDGRLNHFDPLMFVTFGNHEFDKGKEKHASRLKARIDESEFTWLDSNINWQKNAQGEPLVASDKLKKWALVTLPGADGPVKVGLFSITTDMAHPAYIASFDSATATAARYVPLLRQKGADVVIALTHQTLARDQQLLQLPPEQRPDMIFGGHEHYHQLENIQGRWIAKADADALSAIVAPLEKTANGVETLPVLVMLDETVLPDTGLLASVGHWLQQMDKQHCEKTGQQAGCLSAVYGKTRVELVGEESEIRRFETSLGNFVADTALQAFKDCGADMAVVNAGSIRLNQNIAAGSPITSQHLESMFAYPSPLALIRIDGKTLKHMLARSIEGWTANGHWLLTAGFRFTHDPQNQRFSNLRRNDNTPIRNEDSLLLVVPEYLIDNKGDQDGYHMLNAGMKINCPHNGIQLKDLLIQHIRQQPEGIAPRIDGRICNTLRAKCPE